MESPGPDALFLLSRIAPVIAVLAGVLAVWALVVQGRERLGELRRARRAENPVAEREGAPQTEKAQPKTDPLASNLPWRARLTEGHRRVLIVGGALCALVFLFPPWWTPPRREVGRSFFRGYAPIVYRPLNADSIAWPILGVELAAIALVAGAVLTLLPRAPSVCPFCRAGLLPVTRIVRGSDMRVMECPRSPVACSYSSRIELARWR